MFLSRLNANEKNVFLSLAMHAAQANGVVEAEEYTMIQEYCKEMGVAFFDARNIRPFDEVASFFQNTDQTVKRIVILEIIGLMNADGTYDDQEREFVKTLARMIDVSEESVERMNELIDRYLNLVREMVTEIG